MPDRFYRQSEDDDFPPPPEIVNQALLARFIEESLLAGSEPNGHEWRDFCEGLDGDAADPLYEGPLMIFRAHAEGRPDDFACLPKSSNGARFISEHLLSAGGGKQGTTLESREYDPVQLMSGLDMAGPRGGA